MPVKKCPEIEVKPEGLILKFPAYYVERPANIKQGPDTEVYGFDITTLYCQAARRGTYNGTLRICYNLLDETLQKRFLIRKDKRNSLHGPFALNKRYPRFGAFILVCAFLSGFGSMRRGIVKAIDN